MKTLIPYFGGKARLASKIIRFLPYNDHTNIYCEPFGGGGSVLLNKPPHPIEVYNDRNEALTALFLCLSDKDRFAEFYGRVCLLPYSRTIFNFARNEWLHSPNPVDRAVAFYLMHRQCFGGRGHSWGYSRDTDKNGTTERRITTNLRALDALPDLHERIQHILVENNDWRKVLTAFDTPNTVFYCDPPYTTESRQSGGYKHEMTDQDHLDLTQQLARLKGRSLLSGYNTPIYRSLEDAGWRRLEWAADCCAMGSTRLNRNTEATRSRIECLWVHPGIPVNSSQIQDSGAKLAVGRVDDSLF